MFRSAFWFKPAPKPRPTPEGGAKRRPARMRASRAPSTETRRQKKREATLYGTTLHTQVDGTRAQRGLNIPQMPSQSRLGRDFLPNGSTFIKHAQACTDCMSSPRACLFFAPFPPKASPRARLEKDSLKVHQKSRKVTPRVPQRCPKDPRMAPRVTKNHSKISLWDTWAARARFQSPRGHPPGENDLKKRPGGI